MASRATGLKRPTSTATSRSIKRLRTKPPPAELDSAVLPPPSDEDSDLENSSPPQTSLLDSVDLSKLGPILERLKQDPALAYLLSAIKKGLARAISQGAQLDKDAVLAELKEQLLANPTLLAAIRAYKT